jgi:hypothetical protein
MESNDSQAPEFIRRKFTLPETLDTLLQELATQHYAGNVSLCIRAAIEAHQEMLDNNESLTLHRIENQIDSIHTDIQSLLDVPNTPASRLNSDQRSNQFSALGLSQEQSAVTSRVYTEFKTKETALRVADLIDRVEHPPESIVRACEQLLDSGCLIETDQPRRYRRPTIEVQNEV